MSQKINKRIKIQIDGQSITCSAGETILSVAKRENIFIPSLCFNPDLEIKANCRVCVVEIKGRRGLFTACSTKVEDGLFILTDSPKVKRARRLNLELLFAEHAEKCPTCTRRFNCDLLNLARRYNINIKRFVDRKSKRPTYKFANSVELDGSQCIDCRHCVEVCDKIQHINYLKIAGKGADQEIVPSSDKNVDCIYCGQCTLHCPVAAAQEQDDWPRLEKLLKDKKKIKVAQFAPSLRVAIGESFGFSPGSETSGQIVSALKALGFDYVFDVNFGADVTTVVEANELLSRLADKRADLPMLTSCCPAWVKYVEFFHPELIPNLTDSRSPQIHLAGLVKTYFARQIKKDPKNIKVVSFMPCTAKKFEARRSELKIAGQYPVDMVLTTRELAFMLKSRKIDLAKLTPLAGDSLLSEASGAAAIYGASGGVMESALRTANFLACQGKKSSACRVKIDFKEVRGSEGFRQAVVDIAGRKLRVGVVSGVGVFDKIKKNLKDYDYIEVMACPGGCIGGGGQPIPTTKEIVKARAAGLYSIDKAKNLRQAHKNREVLTALKWLEDNNLSDAVLRTHYRRRK